MLPNKNETPDLFSHDIHADSYYVGILSQILIRGLLMIYAGDLSLFLRQPEQRK